MRGIYGHTIAVLIVCAMLWRVRVCPVNVRPSYMCGCVDRCVCGCVWLCVCVCMYVRVWVYVRVCVCVDICACVSVSVWMYVCGCLRECVCVCGYMCVLLLQDQPATMDLNAWEASGEKQCLG